LQKLVRVMHKADLQPCELVGDSFLRCVDLSTGEVIQVPFIAFTGFEVNMHVYLSEAANVLGADLDNYPLMEDQIQQYDEARRVLRLADLRFMPWSLKSNWGVYNAVYCY